jgi:hypothetical protein
VHRNGISKARCGEAEAGDRTAVREGVGAETIGRRFRGRPGGKEGGVCGVAVQECAATDGVGQTLEDSPCTTSRVFVGIGRKTVARKSASRIIGRRPVRGWLSEAK